MLDSWGQVPQKQTVPSAGLWGAIQVLSRLNEKTHIQLPIDAMYVTKGVTHRREVAQGPNGDLCSIFSQLIDERTGNTNIPEVKSHLDDAGPAAIKQKKMEVHHRNVSRHKRCRHCDIYRAHRQFHFWRNTTAQAAAVFRRSVAKRQYTSAFSPVPPRSHCLLRAETCSCCFGRGT